MELVLHKELESVPEPIEVPHFTTHGILNSNYKSLVKNNFRKSNSKSIFGIRQRLRASQFNVVNHAEVILKISVFALVLIAIF
ncbi:hypothetical protein [Winogradskyella alexanderae]|jgi:hypothetical protein|uniref:Uncharacterized protein n=1 Tax=Winogradskyella alexanderae TaxID=2877123 RepID=A0ABS7XQY8_9FLAO|nr:hypothetical protein [Winogradskyella alexanderae]MCA0132415.1 hypothetical protein [Winogradskyella alexanderae]